MKFKKIDKTIRNYKILNIIAATIYVWFYDFIYYNYIVDLFNWPYVPMDSGMSLWLYVSGVVPMFFFQGLKYIASLFSMFVYIFAYIPFNETLSVCGYSSEFNDYRAVFFLAMCAFFMTDHLTLMEHFFKKAPKITYQKFEKVSTILFLIVIGLNVRNLHLTNFVSASDDMYDLRENLSVVGGSLAIYILFWMKNTTLPIILVYNLKKNNKIKSVLVFIGCILVYMIDQQKLTFIAPFVITLLWYIYKANQSAIRNYYHLMIIGILTIIPYLLYKLKDISDAIYTFAAILIMRTQCIEGMELNTYFNWFGHSGKHPYTYYTHINIIGKITGAYPYDTSIGQVVTSNDGNANGVFWLMDGIAAGGLWGCVFISIIYIIVKSLFNGLHHKCKVELFAILSTFAMASAMNLSLFTALFSCGLIVFYLLFIYVDFSDLKKLN